MARLLWFVGICAFALAAQAQTRDRSLFITPKEAPPGDARTALVIGNSAYLVGPLRNPVNDARAIAQALGEAGFAVQLLEDASQAAMHRAVRDFGDRIAKGGVGLFYFAGHGLQVKGRNYLVPVNADIAREDEIEFSTVDVNLVLAKMDSAKNALNIVILDACRNNPFQRSFRSVQSGLAQMDAPTGTFIAFATAPGSVASDGTDANGVYTKHLLGEMRRPGVQIEQLFKQVRIGVMAETKGQQIPWESSSLRGDFSFRPGVAQSSAAELVAEALRRERETQRVEMQKVLEAALERQRKELEAAGLRPSAFPSAETMFWESIKSSTNAADFRAYLERYPRGQFAKLAENRLAALESTTAAEQPPKLASIASTFVASQPASSRLPRAGDTWTYRLTEPRGSPRNYVVKVAAATPDAILDHYSLERGPSGEWAHTAGSYIVGLGKSLFAPYLQAFSAPAASFKIGRVQIVDTACTGSYLCEASARVIGPETVRVPAGTFDTVKVEVEHWWRAAAEWGHVSHQMNGGHKLTVWYAPAAKRAVKYSSGSVFGHLPPIDTHFQLELLSYKLQ